MLEPNIAKKISIEITNKILLLKNFPYIGQIYQDYQNRFLVYKKFLIFYEIKENKNLIIIKRILHQTIRK